MAAKVKKFRADELLVERNLAEDLAEAAKMVMAGMVRTGPDSLVRKSSELFPEDAALLVETPCPYVSRGAFKLLEALERHRPDLNGTICLDVGASTGGFSDLMLQKGAAKVYAVDVGRGQLHAKLRNDPRVVSLEELHAREITETLIPDMVDLIAMDVSFISATRVMEPADARLKRGGFAFILVKPQFEAAKRDAPNGVVVDEKIRAACVEKVADFARERLKWEFLEALPCPIKGPKGNQEFMAVFRKP